MDEAKLLKVYKHGMDRVIESGVMRIPGRFILLRGITDQIIANKAHGLETRSLGNVRDAEYFEIIGVGAKVVGDFPVGFHCMHISAAGDPVSPRGECIHTLVHEDDICLIWDPAEVTVEDS